MQKRISIEEFRQRVAKGPVAKKRRKSKSVSESTIVTKIVEGLTLNGIWAVRINSFVIHKDCPHCGGFHTRQGEPGLPDIWTQYGWIEAKTPIGKLNKDQVVWHAKAQHRRVNVGVARTLAEAIRLIEKWRSAMVCAVCAERLKRVG